MDKLLYGGAFLITVFLAAGALFFPNDSIMWLASTSRNFIILRIILGFVTLALLMSQPPRNVILRGAVGLFGLFLFIWAGYATYADSMKFFDSIMLISMSIAFMLASLEFKAEEAKTRAIMINFK